MELEIIARNWPLLAKGMGTTLQLLAGAAFLSLSFGFLFGIATCSRLRVPVLSRVVEGITFTLRAIPFFVQLLLIYFVIPHLLGFELNPLPAAIVSLGLCSSGYVAQSVKGGLNSIPVAQWESCFVLGLSNGEGLRHVILPQLKGFLIPVLNNELEALLKSTSIASSIGLLELTRAGMNIVSREMDPVPIYLTIAILYTSLSILLRVFLNYIERKYVES
jgi:His/Glu/Gln/Arg/opine family amino acid ABC transporter permease subunit